mmetsp:Transcript_21983/g.55395  ORF Transcript_21983/g.55395 Transcript_21983/m.55395 type:complete len:527 (-) Transcript_21983:280-1860(-)
MHLVLMIITHHSRRHHARHLTLIHQARTPEIEVDVPSGSRHLLHLLLQRLRRRASSLQRLRRSIWLRRRERPSSLSSCGGAAHQPRGRVVFRRGGRSEQRGYSDARLFLSLLSTFLRFFPRRVVANHRPRRRRHHSCVAGEGVGTTPRRTSTRGTSRTVIGRTTPTSVQTLLLLRRRFSLDSRQQRRRGGPTILRILIFTIVVLIRRGPSSSDTFDQPVVELASPGTGLALPVRRTPAHGRAEISLISPFRRRRDRQGRLRRPQQTAELVRPARRFFRALTGRTSFRRAVSRRVTACLNSCRRSGQSQFLLGQPPRPRTPEEALLCGRGFFPRATSSDCPLVCATCRDRVQARCFLSFRRRRLGLLLRGCGGRRRRRGRVVPGARTLRVGRPPLRQATLFQQGRVDKLLLQTNREAPADAAVRQQVHRPLARGRQQSGQLLRGLQDVHPLSNLWRGREQQFVPPLQAVGRRPPARSRVLHLVPGRIDPEAKHLPVLPVHELAQLVRVLLRQKLQRHLFPGFALLQD